MQYTMYQDSIPVSVDCWALLKHDGPHPLTMGPSKKWKFRSLNKGPPPPTFLRSMWLDLTRMAGLSQDPKIKTHFRGIDNHYIGHFRGVGRLVSGPFVWGVGSVNVEPRHRRRTFLGRGPGVRAQGGWSDAV